MTSCTKSKSGEHKFITVNKPYIKGRRIIFPGPAVSECTYCRKPKSECLENK